MDENESRSHQSLDDIIDKIGSSSLIIDGSDDDIDGIDQLEENAELRVNSFENLKKNGVDFYSILTNVEDTKTISESFGKVPMYIFDLKKNSLYIIDENGAHKTDYNENEHSILKALASEQVVGKPFYIA